LQQKFKYLSVCLILICILSGCNNENSDHSKSEHVKETQQIKAAQKQLSDEKKSELKRKVLKIADGYGKEKGLAISNRFYSGSEHNAGDGYAMTQDGELQVSDHNKPGEKAFKVHNVVGISTYHSSNNVKGYDKQAQDLTNLEGYKSVADRSKPISKYLFADNGKVYTYQFTHNEDTTLSTGFAAKNYNGKDPNLKPNVMFTEVKENDLVKQWKKLLSKN